MILSLVISVFAVIAFGYAIWWLRILPVAKKAIDATMTALSSMTDSTLDDHAKERALKRGGVALIALAFGIVWRFALALAAAAVPIVLADAIGLVSFDAVVALMLRVDYIVIVSVIAIVMNRRPKKLAPGHCGNGFGGPCGVLEDL